jgi:hypothetical protein
MPRKSQRAKLVLNNEQRQRLKDTAQSRTAAVCEVECAKIIYQENRNGPNVHQ